ncbi:MAG: hypothetical protein HEQ23_01850 [Tepidisphaera sp.]
MTRLISMALVAGAAGVAMADTPLTSGPMNAGGSLGSRSTLINQQNNGNANRISQQFGDFPAFSTYSFDDVTFANAVDLTSMTVYGTEQGSGVNTAVAYALLDAPDAVSGNVVASGLGSQVGGDLVFDLTGLSLGAGTYWLTAFVVRDFGTGGQWFWNQTGDAISGSEAFVHNPGGGFGFGTGSVPGSQAGIGFTPADMAFTIEGNVVPAPGAFAVMGLGGLIAGRRRR